MTTCPNCKSMDVYGVEYAHTSPNRFDGVSEWQCGNCGKRYGRWTMKELGKDEEEPRYGGQPTDPEEEEIGDYSQNGS